MPNHESNPKKTSNALPVTIIILLLFVAGIAFAVFTVQNSALKNETRTKVTAWVEKLDGQTTKTGVYIRRQGEELPEKDAWDTPLHVYYKQGGVAETVSVRSAGPDKKFYTGDDIYEERMAANFKGIGEGVKNNAAEFTSNVMKGAVKGTADGVKQVTAEAATGAKNAVKDALTGVKQKFKKKNNEEEIPDEKK